jgi:hypothetical protein
LSDTTSISTLKKNWREVWTNPSQRKLLIIGSAIIFIILNTLPIFFRHIEKRKGIVLHDWVLEQIPPHNVSIYIFSIIWGMALLVLIRAINKPTIYICYCWTLIFICIARFISISIVPLDPPIGLIPLTDPLTEVFYGNAFITRDLFFSGHTGTLVLMYLCLQKKTDKIIGLVAIFAVMILLLVQHIHYTIDVLAAPIIVYALHWLTCKYILYECQP